MPDFGPSDNDSLARLARCDTAGDLIIPSLFSYFLVIQLALFNHWQVLPVRRWNNKSNVPPGYWASTIINTPGTRVGQGSHDQPLALKKF